MQRLLTALILATLTTVPLASAAPPHPKKVAPASGLATLMHAQRATVERYLGKPTGSSEDKVDGKGVIYDYVKNGNKWEVEYYGDKASSFDIKLSRTYPTPQAALAAVGLSMGGKRPTHSGSIETYWTGHLFPSGIRRVHVGNFGNGWASIEITDKEEG